MMGSNFYMQYIYCRLSFILLHNTVYWRKEAFYCLVYEFTFQPFLEQHAITPSHPIELL